MPTFSISYEVYASTTVQVEADTPEQAMAIADQEGLANTCLCHQCARRVDIGDLGGMQEVIDLGTGTMVWSATEPQPQPNQETPQ